MAISWSEKVNTNFYGADFTFLENTETLEFESGRKILYLKNSSPRKQISVNLACDDVEKISGKTEFESFIDFYENELLSGSETVLLTDLISHSGQTEYRLISVPSWNGLAIKTISLQFEEV